MYVKRPHLLNETSSDDDIVIIHLSVIGIILYLTEMRQQMEMTNWWLTDKVRVKFHKHVKSSTFVDKQFKSWVIRANRIFQV